MNANLLGSNDPLESRMRETRQSGSVGGGPQANAAFLPQSVNNRYEAVSFYARPDTEVLRF